MSIRRPIRTPIGLNMPNPQRLWQLISPTLPVGAYAYSQGLEYAVSVGWVDDEKTCRQWLGGLATQVMPRVDLPLLQRMYGAWQRDDMDAALRWNRYLLACRESGELWQEDCTMGRSWARLARDLAPDFPAQLGATTALSYATVFSWLSVHWAVELEQTLAGYLWAWCENQVAAAIKLIPLGQTAGQRLLLELGEVSPAIVAATLTCADDDLGMTAHGLGIASAQHETQYTRLFRS